jgi:hypothetical protein
MVLSCYISAEQGWQLEAKTAPTVQTAGATQPPDMHEVSYPSTAAMDWEIKFRKLTKQRLQVNSRKQMHIF